MLNERSVAAVDATGPVPERRLPLYGSYCFSRIPATIEHLLAGGAAADALPRDVLPAPLGDGAEGVERVVLLLVDGFGWRSLERYAERYPFLARLLAPDGGAVLSKLTAMFPSTTTAHVTCIHTGLAPGASGLYEWFQYEPALDAVIAPLLFSFAGERERDGLLAAGAEPRDVPPLGAETVHERLGRAGAASRYVTPAAFTPSPYNDQVCRGAEGHPYRDLEQGLRRLRELCRAPVRGPEYIHFYYGDIDAASHQHGLDSAEVAAAVDRLFTGLEAWRRALARRRGRGNGRRGAGGRTLVLMTADHGMIASRPDETVYLNREWPAITERLARTGRGAPIVPAGSPRDFFLHVAEDRLGETIEELRARLDAVADVHPTSELVARGLFGPGRPAARFLERVGNAVILPRPGRAVWWYEKGRFRHKHHADHGGLSREEMEIPLAAFLL